MITRRHFLKMIGYSGAALAAVKMGGVAVAKSLMKEPAFKGSFAWEPLITNGFELSTSGWNGHGFVVGDRITFSGNSETFVITDITESTLQLNK